MGELWRDWKNWINCLRLGLKEDGGIPAFLTAKKNIDQAIH